MGSWGITAQESDTGLDYLALIKEKCLNPIDYEYFDVKATLEMLKTYIVEEIKRANKGATKKQMEYFMSATFPYRYTLSPRACTDAPLFDAYE